MAFGMAGNTDAPDPRGLQQAGINDVQSTGEPAERPVQVPRDKQHLINPGPAQLVQSVLQGRFARQPSRHNVRGSPKTE